MEIRKVSAVKINPELKEAMMKLSKERLVLDCIHLSNACDGYMSVINALCDGALFARFTKKQRLAYRLYRANRVGKKP
jgi:hypothetical protein